MKVYVESTDCELHVRVHFTVSGGSFPRMHIERLFNYDGYVRVCHTLHGRPVELCVTPDLQQYTLPPDLKELELMLSGEEVVLTEYEVSQKMLSVLAYANDKDVKVQILTHPSQEFAINKKVLSNMTKAMKDTRKHLEIQQQAVGMCRIPSSLIHDQSTCGPDRCRLIAVALVRTTSRRSPGSTGRTSRQATS